MASNKQRLFSNNRRIRERESFLLPNRIKLEQKIKRTQKLEKIKLKISTLALYPFFSLSVALVAKIIFHNNSNQTFTY